MSPIPYSERPERDIEQFIARVVGAGEPDVLALRYRHQRDYLPESPDLDLLALVAARPVSATECELALVVEEAELAPGELPADWDGLARWADRRRAAFLRPDRPLQLQTVAIAKPWGQEIWYTGIEARGQSAVVDERGRAVPLPWLLSCWREHLLAGDGQPILLKILDPLPEPVLGDLYFEMHREKREVYVVTHVDENAWPEGEGGIRFGFDQGRRAAAGSDRDFKREYLAAVDDYRTVRREVDAVLDDRRRRAGIALDAPLPPETMRQWLAELPDNLRREEAVRRERMDSFANVSPLRVGDVVQVPCLTPHSLLHGVRTVEFQTPVYERKILSFGQKVLTQHHWDTEEALQEANLDVPPTGRLPVLYEEAGVRIEAVAAFDDFRVERLSLEPGAAYYPGGAERYRILMGITGPLSLGEQTLAAERALLLPARRDPGEFANPGSHTGIALLAIPVA